MRSILAMMAVVTVASAQHYSQTYGLLAEPQVYANQAGVAYDPAAPNPRHLAHKAVVENAAIEAQLPQELINPFYKNPQVAAGLAKESWFTDKEFPVFHRQADKIPREEIAKIIRRIQHQRR